MKRQFCHFFTQKNNSNELSSSCGAGELWRACMLLLLFPVLGLLLLLLGNSVDFSEWLVMLDDGLILESLALSLFSVLIINPVFIEHFWRVFYFLAKVIHGLFSSRAYAALSIPLVSAVEQAAHGCRAPPLHTPLFSQ